MAHHFLTLRSCTEREGWRQKVEEDGFTWHTLGGKPYWSEGRYLKLTPEAAEVLEDAATALHPLCLDACDQIIKRDWFSRMAISQDIAGLIMESWKRKDPALYGRFDLAWDGSGSPKMLEYNADTPTSLLESAVIQWRWKEDVFPRADQFNSLHEGLIEAWKKYPESTIHFTCDMENHEDRQTTAYLAETAEQAGKTAHLIDLADIGLTENHALIDLDGNFIDRLFKLYPWEFLVQDKIFPEIPHLLHSLVEPIWKMLLSNKAILPILWELNPNHPLLLPAYFDPKPLASSDYVCKPALSREGANVTIVSSGKSLTNTHGPYTDSPLVYQKRADVLRGVGTSAIFGLWMVENNCRGMCVREEEGFITSNAGRYVPHILA